MMKPNRISVAAFAGLLALSSVSLFVPVSSAHDCAAYDGCDAGACKDGENHDHTNYNVVGQNEHCSSKEKTPPPPPRDPESCDYFGQTWPPIVCNLIESTHTRLV